MDIGSAIREEFGEEELDKLEEKYSAGQLAEKVRNLEEKDKKEKIMSEYTSPELVEKIGEFFGLQPSDYEGTHIHKSGLSKIGISLGLDFERIDSN